MISVLPGSERGFADHGWLRTYYSFSFADYHHPERMQFRCLRVLNEDFMQPERGFGTHPHRNMEILTYVLSGTLAHKDSMGFGEELVHGDVQLLSAGRGITHSEINPSKTEPLHLLQIWILPKETRTEPRYERRRFERKELLNTLRLVASGDGAAESVLVNQDIRLYASILERNSELQLDTPDGRYIRIQIARGELELGGHLLKAGDAAHIDEPGSLRMRSAEECELLLFDLP